MKNDALLLTNELAATIGMIGFKKTIAALQNSRISWEKEEPAIRFVVEMVCTQYSVSFVSMTDERTTSPNEEIKYARAFILYYLRSNFEISWPDLRTLLKRHQNHLHREIKLIDNLKPGLAADCIHLDNKKSFDQRIKKYITTKKTTV
jgi:hypothetical protein